MTPKCECAGLAPYYMILPQGSIKNLAGATVFPQYFKGPEELDITTDCEVVINEPKAIILFRWKICSQLWYYELAAEESITECFAVKITHQHDLETFNPLPIKQFLTLLANNGFGQKTCGWKDCENFTLGEKNICLQHYGVLKV